MDRLLTIILAGGEGRRLLPLTRERSKSAVPFGGKYRIIDFTLSNCINSGVRRIYVLTQYRSSSLSEHIQEGWGISSSGLGEYIYSIPAQQKHGRSWYKGTADAISQNMDLIKDKEVDSVLVLSGDHIYKMNYHGIVDFHRKNRSDLTISAVRVHKNIAAGALGVIDVDNTWRVSSFMEKPEEPRTLSDSPEHCLVSMGVYVFKVDTLISIMKQELNDFGKDVIPYMLDKQKRLFVYDYENKNKIRDYITRVKDGSRQKLLVDKTRDSGYWKDVGTIESYYEASMDLIGVDPCFNLYGEKWPFRTHQREMPPSKLVLGGIAQDSILSEGCIISGANVRHSILSPGVVIEKDSIVEESIIFDDVNIGPGVRIRKAIIDKKSVIRSGVRLGYDHNADSARGCTISDTGIVVVPRAAVIEPV
jgi:glucose-1-phosphate adenylyltransferase